MSDIKVGDRVKVARPDIEGEVIYASHLAKVLDVELHDGSIITTTHIDVVTKLASPPKVGDVIRHSDYSSLPTGTVVASHSGGTRPSFIRRPSGDWYDIHAGRSLTPDDLSSERKILYLPES